MQLNVDSYADFQVAVAAFGTPAPVFYRFTGPSGTALVVAAACGGVVVKGNDNVNPPTPTQFTTDFPAAILMAANFDLNA